MWKWLIILVAVVVLYKLITNGKNRKDKNEEKIKEKKIAKGELVKDPVCGVYVDAESSISVRDGKTVHRFCSYDCRNKFLNELEEGGREIPEYKKDEDD